MSCLKKNHKAYKNNNKTGQCNTFKGTKLTETVLEKVQTSN